MSMFVCHECGAYADSDDGCGVTEDGKNLVCMDCVCEECWEKPAMPEQHGHRLCETCITNWAKKSSSYNAP